MSPRDITTMYSRSVVLYQGEPIYIRYITGDLMCIYTEMSTGYIKATRWAQDKFKNPAIRLGYINLGQGCAYLYRKPVRQYRVGLSSENTSVRSVDMGLSDHDKDLLQSIRRDWNCKNIYDTLTGVYPSFEDAYREAMDIEGARAFDRQFAVDWGGNIYYKSELVGNSEDGVIVFLDSKDYLRNNLPEGVRNDS